MLIDGGGSYGGFDAGERIVAPYLWSQKIMRVDYIALSHPDLDHFGGLDFIAMNFAPRAFWTTGVSSLDVSYSRFMDDLEGAKIPTVQVLKKAPLASVGGVAISSLNGNAAIATDCASNESNFGWIATVAMRNTRKSAGIPNSAG